MIDASTPHDVLAAALAAAFPTWEARSALAREAGLGDVQLTGDATAVWRDLVDEGAQRGRLEALLRAADARHAGWRRARWLRYAPLAAVLAVIAVSPLAYRLVMGPAAEQGGDAAVPPDISPAGADAAVDAGAPISSAPDQPAPADVPQPAAAPDPAAAREPDAPAAAPVPQESAPAATVPAAAQAAAPGSCAGKTGWAYLGTSTDVVASDAWTLTRSYNVRTDYPRRDNHYAMAPTICVLHPGDVVAVPDGPQPVDGGAFWIRIQGR